ncbi:MAG: 6-carboxytetrahydropterin synthase QueD [Bacteroidetes bacterium GWF2_42_66]|nr:MAG: 6-carboxytetrahydropterin synthase QueD [Bacteroidetes bacterium GWA2_42_15]OFX95944.1 MAG: 6-carboxytetrahydropterin synthase QueD [Bacteroidetes bacterium GWE2_42_39]OFY46518.1 MAG: 6-carboxytetrahydropterin synthase QueD [Bacteroidetes bacterium GWF2_42_66]HBL75632.1 6-carboxytetrahydropterin synthase QueD [Prolixibacteraceae bacterium]HCU62659.1 6-carboxytetrahydropterin synthase QueD [Prolixibacteraceae bacterium]
MATIRVTKQFGFEMSHALFNYDGLCKNIHGHSYKLRITISGEPLNNPADPKNGMVIDFSDLKKLINKHIVDELDHSLMINAAAPHRNPDELGQMYERLHLVGFQPTTENLVVYIAEKIQKLLPANLKLFSVRLYETANSFAEWFASDNL